MTVYADVDLGGPKQYPIGAFAYLGTMDENIDGFDIPEELTVVPYERGDFRGSSYGPYVGPLVLPYTPERDVYSSLVIRERAPDDAVVIPFRFYTDASFSGVALARMPGRYPDLSALGDGQADWTDIISSYDGPAEYVAWGFDSTSYGGSVYGPTAPPVSQVDGNDTYASLVIQPASEPVVVIFLDTPGDAAARVTYPIVDVAAMGDANGNDGVDLPPGYVIYGYKYPDFGSLGERYVNDGSNVARFFPGTVEGDAMANDWDSFQVRPIGEPTVTLYFADAFGNPQVYPTGIYRDLNSGRTNNIRGASVPCGITVEAFTCDDYSSCNESPGQWTIVGPYESADVGDERGRDNWDSMKIYANGDACS